MSTYNWLRQRYIAQLEAEVEDMIEYENVDPDTAGAYYVEKLQEWEDGYESYIFDCREDR